jgi:hypothetical protein
MTISEHPSVEIVKGLSWLDSRKLFRHPLIGWVETRIPRRYAEFVSMSKPLQSVKSCRNRVPYENYLPSRSTGIPQSH